MNSTDTTLFYAGSFHARACHAYRNVAAKALEPQGLLWDAIVAIIFATTSVECFANEFVSYAAQHPQAPKALAELGGNVRRRSLFARAWRFLSRQKPGAFLDYRLQDKIVLIAESLGQPFQKGSLPFQDFYLLIRLRNALIHMNLVCLTDPPTPPDVFGTLKQRKLTRDAPSWYEAVMTPEIARWSCETASAIVCHIVDALPKSYFQQTFSWFGSSAFPRKL